MARHPGGQHRWRPQAAGAAIKFVTDPSLNSIASSGVAKFLFVESFGPPPFGCTQGVDGLGAIGLKEPADFEKHDATTLNAELDLLGSQYAALVVASDHGGNLKQAELDILNARRTDIAAFVDAGGGLFAMAESNAECGNTPGGGHSDFMQMPISRKKHERALRQIRRAGEEEREHGALTRSSRIRWRLGKSPGSKR